MGAATVATRPSLKAIGLDFEAIAFLTMRSADGETLEAFEQALEGIPAIVAAQRLFGDPDHLLRILTTWSPTSASATITSRRCPASNDSHPLSSWRQSSTIGLRPSDRSRQGWIYDAAP